MVAPLHSNKIILVKEEEGDSSHVNQAYENLLQEMIRRLGAPVLDSCVTLDITMVQCLINGI